MRTSSFKKEKINHLVQPMFFGEGVNIARYDIVKYPVFDKLIDRQLKQFWRPEEISLAQDMIDFEKLNEAEEHIFVSNLKRQTMLDSVQGRAPNLAFLPFCSLPELETWIENWSQNETVHSRSYTYILQNLFIEPDKVFDSIMDNEKIVACADQVSRYYDDLIEYGNVYNLFGLGKITINLPDGSKKTYDITMFELRRKLALAVASVNVLEGVRFYVSFACSWAFAEREIMEGNATIIKLICRDENLHLSSTQHLINIMRKNEDEQMIEIWASIEDEVGAMFDEAVADEKTWAKYLFEKDYMIGLNEKIL